jgi:hypothetical protein
MTGSITTTSRYVMELAARAFEYEKPRPLSEYHEDMGPVLWWKFPIEEAPYVGSPLDCGYTVQIDTEIRTHARKLPSSTRNFDVGGWPGYHTHWTPIPKVIAP